MRDDEGSVLAIGGTDVTREAVRVSTAVSRYRLDQDRWEPVPDLRLPTPMVSLGGVVAGGDLVVTGHPCPEAVSGPVPANDGIVTCRYNDWIGLRLRSVGGGWERFHPAFPDDGHPDRTPAPYAAVGSTVLIVDEAGDFYSYDLDGSAPTLTKVGLARGTAVCGGGTAGFVVEYEQFDERRQPSPAGTDGSGSTLRITAIEHDDLTGPSAELEIPDFVAGGVVVCGRHRMLLLGGATTSAATIVIVDLASSSVTQRLTWPGSGAPTGGVAVGDSFRLANEDEAYWYDTTRGVRRGATVPSSYRQHIALADSLLWIDDAGQTVETSVGQRACRSAT